MNSLLCPHVVTWGCYCTHAGELARLALRAPPVPRKAAPEEPPPFPGGALALPSRARKPQQWQQRDHALLPRYIREKRGNRYV